MTANQTADNLPPGFGDMPDFMKCQDGRGILPPPAEKAKTWKPWPGSDCPDCGCGTEVESDADAAEGWTTDCDRLRCSDPACPRHTQDLGHTIVEAEDDVGDSFDGWPIGDDDKPYNPNAANTERHAPSGAR